MPQRNKLFKYESTIFLQVGMSEQQLEITTMGEKGQVVIPHMFREAMGLKTKTKLVVIRSGDMIVMKTLEMPDVQEEWEKLFKKMDAKKLNLSDSDITKEVKKYRKAKRKK